MIQPPKETDELSPQDMVAAVDNAIASFIALTNKGEIAELGHRLKDEFLSFGDATGTVAPQLIRNADLRQRVLDVATETSPGQFTLGRDAMIKIVDGLVAKHHARVNEADAVRLREGPELDPSVPDRRWKTP